MLTVRGRVKTLDGSVNRFGDPVVIYYIRCGCMQKHMPDPQSFVPLTPAIAHILLALADQDRHGYAIMQEVERLTDGAARMGPGTLYGTIKRMIASGLLEEADERPDPELDDERRRYYRLTDFGFRVATAEAQRLEQMVRSARAKKLLPKTKAG